VAARTLAIRRHPVSRLISDHIQHPTWLHSKAQIPLRRLPRNFPERESFGEVGIMEFGLKGTSRVCRGRHGEVGIVEFGLNGFGKMEPSVFTVVNKREVFRLII